MTQQVANIKARLNFATRADFVRAFAPLISAGGMFLKTKQLKPQGTTIRFDFSLADGSRILFGEGVVRQVKQPSPQRPNMPSGMLVKFTKLNRASKELVALVVDFKQRGDVAIAHLRREAPLADSPVPRASAPAVAPEPAEQPAPAPQPAPPVQQAPPETEQPADPPFATSSGLRDSLANLRAVSGQPAAAPQVQPPPSDVGRARREISGHIPVPPPQEQHSLDSGPDLEDFADFSLEEDEIDDVLGGIFGGSGASADDFGFAPFEGGGGAEMGLGGDQGGFDSDMAAAAQMFGGDAGAFIAHEVEEPITGHEGLQGSAIPEPDPHTHATPPGGTNALVREEPVEAAPALTPEPVPAEDPALSEPDVSVPAQSEGYGPAVGQSFFEDEETAADPSLALFGDHAAEHLLGSASDEHQALERAQEAASSLYANNEEDSHFQAPLGIAASEQLAATTENPAVYADSGQSSEQLFTEAEAPAPQEEEEDDLFVEAEAPAPEEEEEDDLFVEAEAPEEEEEDDLFVEEEAPAPEEEEEDSLFVEEEAPAPEEEEEHDLFVEEEAPDDLFVEAEAPEEEEEHDLFVEEEAPAPEEEEGHDLFVEAEAPAPEEEEEHDLFVEAEAPAPEEEHDLFVGEEAPLPEEEEEHDLFVESEAPAPEEDEADSLFVESEVPAPEEEEEDDLFVEAEAPAPEEEDDLFVESEVPAPEEEGEDLFVAETPAAEEEAADGDRALGRIQLAKRSSRVMAVERSSGSIVDPSEALAGGAQLTSLKSAAKAPAPAEPASSSELGSLLDEVQGRETDAPVEERPLTLNLSRPVSDEPTLGDTEDMSLENLVAVAKEDIKSHKAQPVEEGDDILDSVLPDGPPPPPDPKTDNPFAVPNPAELKLPDAPKKKKGFFSRLFGRD